MKIKTLTLAAVVLLLAAIPSMTAVTQLILTIDGKAMPGNLIKVNERHYVAVSDLAEGLGYQIKQTSAGFALSKGTSDPVVEAAKAKDASCGRIKGTLTYYFNANYGNKPDAGAKVWLVPADTPYIPAEAIFLGIGAVIRTGKVGDDFSDTVGIRAVKNTIADGNGNFTLDDVQPGLYDIIIRSAHVNGKGQRDVSGKVYQGSVTVEPARTKDISHDFGMNYY